MTVLSLSLVLMSACLHVVQHVTLKQARNRAAFVWWMWLWAAIVFLPVPMLLWRTGSAAAWTILVISAVFEALYYTSMVKAYKTGDLSIVYPLARGTAPLLILVWGSALLRERPSIGGVAGIGLIAAGLCVLNLPGWAQLGAWREVASKLNQQATRWALLAGICISLYTAMDKAGVQLLPPLLYTYLTMTLAFLWLTPAALRSVGWQGLMAEWRASRFSSFIAGVTAMGAYMIILYVMYSGAPASYVGATREISVVLATIVGALFLKERGGIMRLCGSSLIAVGVAAIAVLG